MEQLNEFFANAREREHIRLRRAVGLPQPWSEDPVFCNWRFCNVRREDDKTTVWFRDNVRSKVSGLKAVEATVIFRLFNRIETGEIIRDLLIGKWNTDEAYRRLEHVHPVITGAYIVSSPAGFSKLNGILEVIDGALAELPSLDLCRCSTLEEAWNRLKGIRYLGAFHAYEMISDLRWTDVLWNATDIMTWANAGPGCARGLGRVVACDPTRFNRGSRIVQAEMLEHMRYLVAQSQLERHWPQVWPPWEMREVEHWLCEHDKICRARNGDRLKRRYP